jgi:hypothetical protein
MPRTVDWPAYDRLTQQLLAVVQAFLDHDRIDYETMMAVLVMFQASILTGPAMRVQDTMADLDGFLEAYANDVTRMIRQGIERARALYMRRMTLLLF